MCKYPLYPSDPTVAYGYRSYAFLVACSFHRIPVCILPLQRQISSIPCFSPKHFICYFLRHHSGAIGLAAALLLWPTISEQQAPPQQRVSKYQRLPYGQNWVSWRRSFFISQFVSTVVGLPHAG
ncbi:hypothetical protein TB2_016736 [Malus domestica]